MRLPLPPETREEIRRFDLRFCCEDCVHLDRGQDHCAHGWPTALHRRRRYDDPGCEELVFCKEFELL